MNEFQKNNISYFEKRDIVTWEYIEFIWLSDLGLIVMCELILIVASPACQNRFGLFTRCQREVEQVNKAPNSG